ncbi:hypothetical protein DPEC_G00184660 [Dallia pectoralis]|uniref:Uncharacterized protein n=1 Tax=Dallia pectoralis TaxID=75939 RepID=A0ACC2GB24_DALPE|nr:hypothetical protein DPEC_G00184660 [Dallia pectoralis]
MTHSCNTHDRLFNTGQQSTYGSDYTHHVDRPHGLFRLQTEPSHVTHQKIADLWAQYQRLRFKTSTSHPRNLASTFTRSDTTKTATILERENFTQTRVERTGLQEEGLRQAHHLTPGPGEERSYSLSLNETFTASSEPSHSCPVPREAWTLVTGDLGVGVADKADHGVELPHIGSGEGTDVEAPKVEGVRAEKCRRDMACFSRLEGKINKRFATHSSHMPLGLPFDGVTTYSQSYTPWDRPPCRRGSQHILPEATVNRHIYNWDNSRAWESEYHERYQRPERPVPGRTPPTYLKTESQPGTVQMQGNIRSEYQRQYTVKGYPCLSRSKTSRPHKDTRLTKTITTLEDQT